MLLRTSGEGENPTHQHNSQSSSAAAVLSPLDAKIFAWDTLSIFLHPGRLRFVVQPFKIGL